MPAEATGTEQRFWAKQENRLFLLPRTILLPIEGGTEGSMVANLQENKPEKKLKASGDVENSQKNYLGDLPMSDKLKTHKTESLGSSVGLASGSPVGKQLPKVQFLSLPRYTKGHGIQQYSIRKALCQLVTVEHTVQYI